MDKYLYIFIIFIIFLCICLLSKGCINLYETFSISSQNIKISDTLPLNTTNCEIDPVPDPCNGVTCQNGGKCNNGVCKCTGGFTGVHCEIDPCNGVTCQNGGKCNNGVCKCTGGFTGVHCEIDPCDGVTCQNDGICNNGTCNCKDGFTGVHCENAVPPQPVPCDDTLDNIVCQDCSTTKIYTESDPSYPDMISLDNNKFHIRIKNTSSKKIMLWLDDLPFCPSWIIDPAKKDIGRRMTQEYMDGIPNLNRGMFTNIPNFSKNINGKITGNNWDNTILGWENGNGPKFRISHFENGGWSVPSEILVMNRYFLLDVGDVLIITPPHSEINLKKTVTQGIKPYQCNYQVTGCNPADEVNDWHGTCKSNNIDLTNYEWYNDPLLNTDLQTSVRNNIQAKNWSLNCGGSGMYITPCLPKMDLENILSTEGLSRIEYNINGGNTYFNLSGVDGINSKISVSFTSPASNNNACHPFTNRLCNISDILNKCPNKDHGGIKYKNEYIQSCVSPKKWYHDPNDADKSIYPISLDNKICNYATTDEFMDNIKKIKIYNTENIVGENNWDNIIIQNPPISDIQSLITHLNNYGGKNIDIAIDSSNIDSFLAGCPVKDNYGKALCHIWWDNVNNPCANAWRNFIENDPTADCQQYTWAYDETKINNFNQHILPFDINGNPLRVNDDSGNPNTWPKNPDDTIKLPLDYQSNNSTVPLLNCSLDNLTNCVYIDVEINDVLSNTLKYSDEDKTLCNNILGNNSVYPQCILNASYSNKDSLPHNFECSDGTKFIFNDSTKNNLQSCLNNVPPGITPKNCEKGQNGNGATTCDNYEDILNNSPCIWKDHTLCGHGPNYNTKNNKHCYPKIPKNLNPDSSVLTNICSDDPTYEKCTGSNKIWCESGHYGIDSDQPITVPVGPPPAGPCPKGCSECCNHNSVPKQQCDNGVVCPVSGCCD